MKEEYLISVIVPIYNAERYLERCIAGIRNQTYRKIQILLVDDGSTDGSGGICDRYRHQDGRIEVIHKENGGVTSARKAGLVAAKGEYIGFVDSDDYIEEGYYEHLLEFILETRADFVQAGFVPVPENAARGLQCPKCTFSVKEQRTEYIARGLIEMKMPDFRVIYSMCTKLFKADLIRECIQKIPDTLVQGEDMLCICSCMLVCDTVATLNREEYYCTVRQDSLSRTRSLDKFVQIGKLYESLCRLFESYEGYGAVRRSLDLFYENHILHDVEAYFGTEIAIFSFPGLEDIYGKRVVLYGIGKVGKDYYSQINRNLQCEIVAVADGNAAGKQFWDRQVFPKEEIINLQYDVVLIAVDSANVAEEIAAELENSGVGHEKLIWRKPLSLLGQGNGSERISLGHREEL